MLFKPYKPTLTPYFHQVSIPFFHGSRLSQGAPYSHDLPSFTATVRRVLAALSAADPAGANCLARRVAGAEGSFWMFGKWCFNGGLMVV